MLHNQQIITDMGILADIAYSEYGQENFIYYDKVINANEDDSFTLNSSYTVIDYRATLITNMQAILFAKNDSAGNPTDEHVIAFRGTQENLDWISNGLTALVNYNPQISAGRDFVQEMMVAHNISAEDLTLTGHSLGGIITQAVGADLHIQGYAFNPYGANLLSSLFPSPLRYYNVLGQLLDTFGLGDKNDPWIKDNLLTISYQDGGLLNGDILSNLATDFSAFLAGNDHLGGVLPIWGIENANGLMAGHDITTLNAALENYNQILAKFDDSLDYQVLSDSFLMTGVEHILRTFAEVTGEDSHGRSEELFNRFVNSTATVNGLSMNLLKNETDATLTNQVSDPANLYALFNLNPFTITGTDYSHLNQNGELNVENYSTQYLQDRALFLYHLTHPDATVSNFDRDINFSDTRLTIDSEMDNGMIDANMDREHWWGTEGDDTFGSIANTGNDHLYGMGGNDLLNGYDGNDTLEGGTGSDVLNGGAGNDTFIVHGSDKDAEAYDTFNGGIGDEDTILGGNLDDTIRVNSLSLTANSIEIINGGDGENVIAGTEGYNTIDLTGIAVSNIARIEGGAGADTITGTVNDDNIYGSSNDGDDDWAVDLLSGGAGNDTYHIGIGDIINDSDQQGTIWYGANQITGLSLTQISENNDLYETDNYIARLDTDTNILDVFARNTSFNFTIEDFNSGNFDISLEKYVEPVFEYDYSLTGTESTDVMYYEGQGIANISLSHSTSDDTFQDGSNCLTFIQLTQQTDNGYWEFSNLFPLQDVEKEVSLETTFSIDGAEGNDRLFGLNGSDHLLGGSGNDFIYGAVHYSTTIDAHNADILDGNSGNDYLMGSYADDTMYGGDDQDILNGLLGEDTLSGDAGNDLLVGGGGKDTLTGGDDDDVLYGDAYMGLGFIAFEESYSFIPTYDDKGFVTNTSSDNIWVYNNLDLIVSGNDILSGGNGRDYLNGGYGNDFLFGDQGQDLLIGGEGDDRLDGGAGNDLLIGDDEVDAFLYIGNDTLYGGDGDDELQGGNGADLLYGDGDNDVLAGESGDDALYGGSGNDELQGGLGTDLLYGESGDDMLLGEEGNDHLYGGSENDQLQGGSGADLLYGESGDDVLFGESDDDTLYGGDGDDLIIGDDGMNQEHNISDDILYGGAGNDELQGDGGQDILEGGSGNDLLLGGNGNDIYMIAPGDGIDFISDMQGNNTLRFADSINLDNLELKYATTSYDQITYDADGQDIVLEYGNGDAVVIRNGRAGRLSIIPGGEENDVSFGQSAYYPLLGADSNDTLNGGAGFDPLYGEAGDDILYGGKSYDSLYGGAGNDILHGDEDHDQLYGGEGEDQLFGDSGMDRLAGGAGADYLDGGEDSDRAEYQDSTAGITIDLYNGTGSGGHAEGDCLVNIENVIGTAFADTLLGNDENNELTGGDGNDIINGGGGNDTIEDNNGDNVIHGNGGDDQLSTWEGWGGNNQLFGDAGNDYISAGPGNDLLYGGDDNDWVRGGFGDDLLEGGDGDDYLHGDEGNDLLRGGAGDDTLNGRGGEFNDRNSVDILEGGAGDDTYIVRFYDNAHDFINDDQGNNLVRFYSRSYGAPISLSTLNVFKSGQDIVIIENGDPSSSVTISGGMAELSISYELSDSTHSHAEILAQVVTEQHYDDGNHIITGTLFDDTIYAGDGDDVLLGQTGNDILYGGAGNDTYFYNRGDGIDVIIDTALPGEGNTLFFGEGITADDLTLRIGSLLIETGTPGDEIHIENFNPNDAYGDHAIDTFQFSNDTSLSYQQLIDKGFDLTGNTGDDTITGTNVLDRISGLGGDDIILSGDGDDTIRFGLGDGHDTIFDSGGSDTLELGVGLTVENTLIETIGDDVVVTLEDDSSTIIKDWQLTESRIEDIRFADGTTQAIAMLLAPRTIDYDLSLNEDTRLNGHIEVTGAVNGLQYHVEEASANGDFVIDQSGTWSYSPAQDFYGSDLVRIVVTNAQGKNATSTINLTVSPVNDLPEAAVAEDHTLQDIRVLAGQLAANDVDGDTLTYTASTNPQHGTLMMEQDGNWSYQAADRFIGIDSAVITIDDGNGGATTTTLNFDMRVSAPTILEIGGIDLQEDSVATDQLTVSNPIGGTLSYQVVEAVQHGVFQVAADGSFLYTPTANYNGADTVTLQVSNDYGLSAIQTINLTIEAVNDLPVVQKPDPVFLEGVLSASGMIKADDVDGDILSYSVDGTPQHGTLTVNDQGNWLYTAEDGYCGTDQATITVDDGNDGTVSTSLDLTVNVYEQGDWIIEADGPDAIRLQDISNNELQLTRSADNLFVTIADRGAITVRDYFTAPENGVNLLETLEGPLNLGKVQISEMADAGRSRWWRNPVAFAHSGVTNLIYGTDRHNMIFGAEENDVLFGAAGRDTIKGFEGNDTLIGGDDHDHLFGQWGDDTLFGDSGNDSLLGGSGNDALIGGDGKDLLHGEDGNDWLFGGNDDDTLYGKEGDDQLSGGSGSDTLSGGDGNDTYFLNLGDGLDVISEKDSVNTRWWERSQPENYDTIKLGQGIEAADVSFVEQGNELILQYGDNDVVTIKDQFNDGHTIERIELADNSYLTDTDINQLIQDMAGFAVNEGLSLDSTSQVRQNEDLMTMVTGAWHQD